MVLFGKFLELPPPHHQNYNLLLVDNHVERIKRSGLLNPPNAAFHWNNDNQPHEET